MTGTDDDTAEDQSSPVGIYVYGIVPADVEAADDATGVHDAPLDTVPLGDIAALVSEIDPTRELGAPGDLRAHARILDGTSRVAPVLPLRFGAVVSDRAAVTEELLAAHVDEFAAALDELEGHAEYLVQGRYVEETIIGEIIAENPRAAALLDRIHEAPDEISRDARIELGKFISAALAAKRDIDTRLAVDALLALTDTVTVREPTHDEDAFRIAVLLEVARQEELEGEVGALVERWRDRVTIRLVGPLAPYDFVGKPE